jgi:hypothetical protein
MIRGLFVAGVLLAGRQTGSKSFILPSCIL